MKDTIKLKLKKRGSPKVYLPVEQAKMIIADNDKEFVWRTFQTLANNYVEEHDKDFLELIINWVPEGGQSMMDIARWTPLAIKVDNIDVTKEQTIELTENQANMIYDKLRYPKFKVARASMSLYKFIADFEAVYGRKISEEENEQT